MKKILITALVVVAGLLLLVLLFGDEEETAPVYGTENAVVSNTGKPSASSTDKPATTDTEKQSGSNTEKPSGSDTEKTSASGEDTPAGVVRELFTKVKGDGNDVNTIMIYMIGSDLESEGGNASLDIEEMMSADLGQNVNVIIQTGGAKSWEMRGINADTCQRFEIRNGGLSEVDDIGLKNMTLPSTLSDFIRWTAEEYPANRYDLILWDHGGGTMAGFGSDEHFPEGTLSLGQISEALRGAGVKFDFVGFDACLMGTIETAYMLEPYADYFIASEETEPGTGWYYKNWLTTLGRNPSLDTVSLATVLIDDFVEDGPDASWLSDCGLSIVDLREIPNVYRLLQTYMANNTVYLKNNGFREIASARGKTKEFGDGEYEQIDIVDYLEKIDIEGSNELKGAIQSAVKYHNSNISDTNGMAMYYPYSFIEYYEETASAMQQFGYGDESTAYYNEFVNAMACGQSQDYGMGSFLDNILGSYTNLGDDEDYQSADWFDEEACQSYSDYYEESGYENLSLDDKGDYYALSLSDEEWETIVDITQQVMVDDGEGYIDLGEDSVFEFDDDGDLIVDFNNTWVAVDENIVPFYTLCYEEKEDGRWISYGYVPAIRNDSQNIQIMIQWDNEHEDGFILGYQPEKNGVAPAGKGYIPFEDGDYVQLICDYYTKDGEYDDTYEFGGPFAISMDSVISYMDIGDETVEVCFKLTDFYQNNYWTQTVILN